MSRAANSIGDCNKSNLSSSLAGETQLSEAQLGDAQHGEAQHGDAQHGEEQPGRKAQSCSVSRAPQRRTSYLFPATDTLRPLRRKLRRIINWPFLMLIKGYKLLLSPFLGRSCRFTPTCSTYTYEAIEKYGILKGGLLGAWRILRCNPWGGSGYDPVP